MVSTKPGHDISNCSGYCKKIIISYGKVFFNGSKKNNIPYSVNLKRKHGIMISGKSHSKGWRCFYFTVLPDIYEYTSYSDRTDIHVDSSTVGTKYVRLYIISYKNMNQELM